MVSRTAVNTSGTSGLLRLTANPQEKLNARSGFLNADVAGTPGYGD
jgi:hypothetical protein